MIEWFAWVQVAVAVIAGLLCVVLGLAGRVPNDLVLGALAVVEALLIAQVVVAIIAPTVGNPPTGSLLEFWVYLVSAVLLPPAAALWALLDRGRQLAVAQRERGRLVVEGVDHIARRARQPVMQREKGAGRHDGGIGGGRRRQGGESE